MTSEGSCRRKLAELVTDHIFRYIYGNMLASVVNGKGVADKVGEDCGGAAPGLENLLLAVLIHLLNSFEQFRLHKGSFFNASAHYYLLLSLTCRYDAL